MNGIITWPSEEKTSYDLKQEFYKQFDNHWDDVGEIARCYVTKSQTDNEETFIAFMSMIDTRSHARVVESFNGMVFRGRELVVRISQNKANQARRKRTESIGDTERSSLEDLVKGKIELEVRIEEEKKKWSESKRNLKEKRRLQGSTAS